MMTPFLEGLDRHFAFDVNLNGSKWWFICEIHCFQVALHMNYELINVLPNLSIALTMDYPRAEEYEDVLPRAMR